MLVRNRLTAMSEKAKKVNARSPVVKPRAGARAKACPNGVSPDVKTQRVFRIVRLMNSGTYTPETVKELATEWGLAPPTVAVMACEAKRILDITVDDRKALVRELELRLMEIAKLDGPDRVQAVRTQFEHLGELRKRVELTGRDGEPIAVGVTAKVVVLPALDEPEPTG